MATPETPGIKVVIEHKSALTRVYNVASQLSDYSMAHFTMPISPTSYSLAYIGERGRSLVVAVEENAPGVTEIFLERYELTVMINIAFDWDAIEPAILAEIESLIGSITIQEPEPIAVEEYAILMYCPCTFADGADSEDSDDDPADGRD